MTPRNDHLTCEDCGVAFSTLGQRNRNGIKSCKLALKPKYCSKRCAGRVSSRKFATSEKRKAWMTQYKKTEKYRSCMNKAGAKYTQNNIEKVKEKNRRVKAAWRKANPEENKRRLREHYAKNRDRMCKTNSEHVLIKRKTDPYFRLVSNLRTRLTNALKDQAVCKSGKSFELIGCDSAALRKHLEAQFTKGMSWDNYGEWHVDHIRPCASFDLNDPVQQKKCFGYKNLQPLWAFDNLSKGDSWPDA